MKKCSTCQRQFPDGTRFCPEDNSPLYQVVTVFKGAVIQQKYRVESVIAVGGMSTVYLVEHLIFNEKMAMKVMAAECAVDKKLRDRFDNESRIMRRLQSRFGRNIVHIEDVGETEDGLPFVVMEYIAGEPLSTVICPDDTPESSAPLEVARALRIAIQVCNALEIAHSNNIVHRDIKPENILLVNEAGEEVAKVLDFGIAMFSGGPTRGAERNSMQMEYTGSPHYSSPEQIVDRSGRDIDGRSDLYSMGVVLYEMLTGDKPFNGESDDVILSKHLRSLPKPPTAFVESLPEAVATLTMKALAKSPADRFQDAAEMIRALEEALPASVAPISAQALPEYLLSFCAEQGEVQFSAAIGHHETLSAIMDELVGDLRTQGVELQYYQSGPLHVLWKDRELDQTVALRRQGVQPGDTLVVCSRPFRQKSQLEAWLLENSAPEKIVSLPLEEVQRCHQRFQEILERDSNLAARFSDIEKESRELNAIIAIQRQSGTGAALNSCDKLRGSNPESVTARLLGVRLIDALSREIGELIGQQRFDEALALLSGMDPATAAADPFASLAARLNSAQAVAEAQLHEAVEMLALGDFERGRALAQSLRKKPAAWRGGVSVTRLLEEFETMPAWVQRISKFLDEERWEDAKNALGDRNDRFQLWPPFVSMLNVLTGLRTVQQQSSARGEQEGRMSIVAAAGLLDARWAKAIPLTSVVRGSLADLARQILQAAGRAIEDAEKEQSAADEAFVRDAFRSAIRELAQGNRDEALAKVSAAAASDPALQDLKRELQYV